MIRRATAAILLLCMVLLVPAAATPIRACLLEDKVLAPGFATYGVTSTGKVKCCPDCGSTDKGDSCCMEIKKLPDSPAAPAPALLPPVLFYEIPLDLSLPACPVVELKGVYQPFVPIRGPDSPGLLRARLSIWNI